MVGLSIEAMLAAIRQKDPAVHDELLRIHLLRHEARSPYQRGHELLYHGHVNWKGGDIRAILVRPEYRPRASHRTRSDLIGLDCKRSGDYTNRDGVPLTGRHVAEERVLGNYMQLPRRVFKADPVVLRSFSGRFRWLVITRRTRLGTDLLHCHDLGERAARGQTVRVDWPNGAVVSVEPPMVSAVRDNRVHEQAVLEHLLHG